MCQKIESGETISVIARHFSTSRQTIMRVRNQAQSYVATETFVPIDPTLLVTSLGRLARSTHDLFIITRKIEAVF